MSVRTWIAAPLTSARLTWRRSRLGAVALAAVWIFALGTSAAIALELAFRVRSAYLEEHDPRRYTQLARAYAPFFTEHLHPQYLFFFPPTAAERTAMGNAVCSIDSRGFREPGPGHAGSRKLAFLVGGSVAFGLFASSNETTITSHLNRLQDEYFFVNAGVPGFNSTQELVRLTLELVDDAPALVVAFNGWNDLTLAREPEWVERRFAPGVPEGFPTLQRMVEAAQAPWRHLIPNDLFYELSLRLHRDRGGQDPPGRSADADAAIDRAAERYAVNQQRMAAVARSVGARFISVFQPLAALHRHVTGPLAGPDEVAERFHRLALAGRSAALETHDLGRVFDDYLPVVPVASSDIDDATIFIDAGHLYDPGNEIVARHLLRLIRQPSHEP